MDAVFPSKRDGWIVAVTWLSIAAMIAGSVAAFAAPGALAARVGLAVPVLVSTAFLLAVVYRTDYAVTATEIRVRSGPFRWRVPLAAIASIVPTRNPLSSPAVSLDRLRIAYRNARGRERALMISPADKAGFLAAVAARCPSLALAGDRLAPRA